MKPYTAHLGEATGSFYTNTNSFFFFFFPNLQILLEIKATRKYYDVWRQFPGIVFSVSLSLF